MSKSAKVVRMQRLRRGCLSAIVAMVLIVVGGALTVGSAIKAVLEHFGRDLPSVTSLYYFEPSQTTRIYSADGKVIATLFRENRTWTRLEDISPNVVHAVLAIEDSRFREHRGVDPVGVIRAGYAAYMGVDEQGASTITMQLARNLFLTPKRSLDRKIKEVLLAIKIEQTFTKDEIMEMYLNQIYFGAGAYGVQAASNVYFHKKVKDLDPAQAALIAGLPQSPTTFSPLVDPVASLERQELVLGRMRELGYLDEAGYRKALAQARTMKFKEKKDDEFQVLEVPYFTTYVIKQLYKRFDEDTLYRGGFRIYTTVDLKMQQKAEQTVRSLVKQDEPYLNVHTGSLVCVENKTGYIRAMCGGMGWSRKDQFNRAWQARRQPGSSFKIFVYTTAIESGLSPDTVVPDSPITIGNWSPKNSDGRFMGAITMATALQHSRNVVAVRLIQMVGPQRVIDYAHAMGIESDLQPNPSIALGAVDVSPLEMASAISVIPNQGIKVPTTAIKIIYDAEGNVVEDNRVQPQTEVLAESTASFMVDMMKRVVEAGTATNAYIEGHEVAGKTGTTDSFRDAWFVGYTRDYTTAAWVGNDDFTKMYSSFGGDLPARIWKTFMVYALRNVKESKIPRSTNPMVACLFCAESNKRAGPGCPKVYRKLFARNAMPRYYCDLHGAPRLQYTSGPTDDGRKAEPKPTQAPKQAGPTEDAPIPTQVNLPTGEVPTEVPVGGEPPAGSDPPGGGDPGPAPQPVEVPMVAPEPAPVEVPVAPPAPAPVEVPDSKP